MLELQIDKELQAWIDPLSTEEYALLEASILQDGCRDPLVVWGGYLLDGHNRYEICQKHGLSFSTFEKVGLVTKVDVKIWMIQNQMGKRNTTDFARTALALKLKPLLELRARERQAHGQTAPGRTLSLNSDEALIRTDDSIAKLAGVGRDTVRKVEKIIGKATPEVIAQVRAGEISINAAAKTVTPPRAVAAPAAEQTPAPSSSNEITVVPDAAPENFGPSPEEIAAAVRAEAEQLEYIRNLLASDDDPLALALADLKQKGLEISALRSQNAGHQNTINDQIRMIKSLRSRLAKLEGTV
ncbi:hypothetical protein CR105_16045 [Massilia eurypsychrophila]|uniref:Plasmid replication/partition related protein n=1 Tax=Massilia eurypsychrophila TaxID=1485217 RepID=A0A2G8TCY1_9BURK|nr:hypothetical protein [Massilia eurypsychrophila]PIL43863.1 hypothetical protein CR105_16045 [Massilia eurypsychrophila]